jgi:nitrite reductase/ring-hydroxylating ferredoxin subunit
MHEQLTRRDIIKTILVASATSVIGGKAWAAKTISEVTANAVDPTLGVARILLSSFAALNNNGGSVRLGSSGISGSFPVGLYYPIVINRLSATQYVALDSQCLHAGCVVGALTGGVNGRMSCPCHGSLYTSSGLCVGGPAPIGQSLRSFPTTLEGGILKIEIPDQGFSTRMTQVLNGTEQRLQLTWDSFTSVEYEMRFRPNFATEPTKVNFSTTLTGAFATAFVKGNDTTADEPTAVKAFVPAVDGIYQVAIRLRTV